MRVVFGVLLLTAAGLKLYGRDVAPYAQYGWFHTPWVQTLAIAWEVVLGVWLVSGEYPSLARIAGLLTFAGFAGVSGYLGWVGHSSCGCFGNVQASPWWVLGLDAVAVVAFTLIRPRANRSPESPATRFALADLRTVGFGLVGVAVLVGAGYFTFGSLGRALATLRGDTLGVDTSVLDFGAGRPGDVLEASVQVVNYSDAPIRLIGGTTDCSCIATRDLPVTLAPGEWSQVRAMLNVPPGDGGMLSRRVEFMTDSPDHPTIRLRGVCLVKP